MANLREITDRKGNKYLWEEYNGVGHFHDFLKKFLGIGVNEQLEAVKNLECRDDDVIVCNFPKTGTHWIWEIACMVSKERAVYEKNSKISAMMELRPVEHLDSLPSPRILNTHMYPSCLPDQALQKKIKVIHVMRDPKDVAVSFFYHSMAENRLLHESPYETFSEFLPYVTGEYGVHIGFSMFRYWREMETFSNEHPDLVLDLYFEEMKCDPTACVKQIANFLKKDLPSEIIAEITDKCSFQNLKAADATVKQIPKDFFSRLSEEAKIKAQTSGFIQFYRKGEVGDWKNYFTVAEYEQFDQLLNQHLGENKYVRSYL